MPESSARETSYRWQPRAAKVAIVLLIAALTLSGCIFDRFFGSDAEPTPIAAEEDAPLQEDGTLPRLIERAMADLVQATAAAADEITVVSTEEVEWGDTGLGCPQPEAIYALVITPGYFIVLESGGNTYDYHSGTDPEGPLVQCTEEGVPAGETLAGAEPTEGVIHLDDNQTLPRLIERAIADLVQATDAADDEIAVVSAEAVEWSDSSLGCPQPDTIYLQVITPGYLIVLESGANTYDYHSGTDPESPLVQCVDGQPSAGEAQLGVVVELLASAQDELLPRLIERATADLAQVSEAAADEITVVSTEEVEWSDSSLGCPQPDEMYAQVITPGYRIVLASGGNTYDYHSATDPEGPLVQCSPEADSEE